MFGRLSGGVSVCIAALALSGAIDAQSTITVEPGTDIQVLIDKNRPGTTYLILSGVHRLQTIRPQTGDIFEGAPGAILSGAQLIARFQHDGLLWKAAVRSLPATIAHNKGVPCLPGTVTCRRANDLFMDDRLVYEVDALRELTPGKWYFDRTARIIYLAVNPQGHRIEMSVTPVAFEGRSSDVTIRGLIIEKYANPAQRGAIHDIGTHWRIENNEIRLNHGTGIISDTQTAIQSNRIHHNGQLGIGGSGSGILVDNNEIAYNNWANYDYMGPDGEAGGIKIIKSDNLVIQNNFVHHNNGPGIWLDTDNIQWKVESNRLVANREAGILAEISGAGVIRFNILENEGIATDPLKTSLWWVAGIDIQSSRNIDVYGNTLIDCGNGIGIVSNDRGTGRFGLYAAQNTLVHDNTIIRAQGIVAGLVADVASKHIQAYSSWNNRFIRNHYILQNSTAAAFTWYIAGNTYSNVGLEDWHKTGHDNGADTLISPNQLALVQNFDIGDRVRIDGSNPLLPAGKSETHAAALPAGNTGTVTLVKGPIYYLGEWWWHISYDGGARGWSPGNSIYRDSQPHSQLPRH